MFSPILEVIARLPFVFARTMPHMPHEYTLRATAPNDTDYVALYQAIMRDGVIHWWRLPDGYGVGFRAVNRGRIDQPGQ
jgi:hypothetical protein